jgi:hypothetical protein
VEVVVEVVVGVVVGGTTVWLTKTFICDALKVRRRTQRSLARLLQEIMYFVNDSADLYLFGAASFPGIIGTVSASYPLAVLRLDAGGVSVDIRSRLLKRFLTWFVRQDAAAPWWTAEWFFKSGEVGRSNRGERAQNFRRPLRAPHAFAFARVHPV